PAPPRPGPSRSPAAAPARAAGTTRTAASAPAAAPAAPAATATAAATVVAATAAGRRLLRGLHLGEVLREARGHDLALVDPHLHADPAEGGARLEEAVVDVGAQAVERHAAVRVRHGAPHLCPG